MVDQSAISISKNMIKERGRQFTWIGEVDEFIATVPRKNNKTIEELDKSLESKYLNSKKKFSEIIDERL